MGNSTYHERGKKVNGYLVGEHPNYYIWASMKQRCNNSKNKSHSDYGERGISYDNRWEHFEVFCSDMGVRPSPHHSLERVSNNKGYCMSNCVWADRFAQSQNRRTFKNNTTGVRGVTKNKSGRFVARCQLENKRYKISGTFDDVESAEQALLEFYETLKANKDKAMLMLEPKARFDSSTGIRGITKHVDGGYIVRVTKNKKREYLGHFKNLDDAKKELLLWKQENK